VDCNNRYNLFMSYDFGGRSPFGRYNPDNEPMLRNALLIFLFAAAIGIAVGVSWTFHAPWFKAHWRIDLRHAEWLMPFSRFPVLSACAILGSALLPLIVIMSFERTYDWSTARKVSVWFFLFLFLSWGAFHGLRGLMR